MTDSDSSEGGSGGGLSARTGFGLCATSRPQQMLVQTAGTSVSVSESRFVAPRCHLAPGPGSIGWQQILRTHAARLHNVAGRRGGGGLGDRLVDLCRSLCTRSGLFSFPHGQRGTRCRSETRTELCSASHVPPAVTAITWKGKKGIFRQSQ